MLTSALRPLSLGELLDRTFFLYRKHFLLFVGIIAIPHLVLLALQFVGITLNPRGVGFSTATLVWTLLTALISIPVVAVSHGATVIAVSKVHLGHATTVVEALSSIRGKFVSLSLIMLGIGVGLGIAFMLLLSPGIILALMWSLALPVAVLEDTGLRDTTSRSAELTKGSRGRMFVICFLFIVLTYIVILLWEFPMLAAVGFFLRNHNPADGVPRWFLITNPLGTFVSQCLVGPLLTIALTLAYYDQKVRKEAFDLQLMMSTMDQTQGNTAPVAT
jgi:hypothetical protein